MIKYGKIFLISYYFRGNLNSEESFIDLKTLEAHESSVDDFHNRLFYLSTAPEFFPTVLNHLKSYKIEPTIRKRLVTSYRRKTLGTDLSTAVNLNRVVNDTFQKLILIG